MNAWPPRAARSLVGSVDARRSSSSSPAPRRTLADRDPRDTLGLAGKQEAAEQHTALLAELAELQERLYAESKRSILLVLQGLDASGKDGTIKHVFTGLNPQGCRVSSFKAPTPVELAHDFLWRIHAQCPERGMIGIFNRSHYEDIVTVRVLGLVPPAVWKARPQRVNEFEELLAGDGTTVLKCFLHVSQAGTSRAPRRASLRSDQGVEVQPQGSRDEQALRRVHGRL